MSKESISCGDYNILKCKKCGKLLGKGIVERGAVEIKCPRCGSYNIFQIEMPRGIR